MVDHGPGLTALPWIAALAPLAALGIALLAVRAERRGDDGQSAGLAPEAY